MPLKNSITTVFSRFFRFHLIGLIMLFYLVAFAVALIVYEGRVNSAHVVASSILEQNKNHLLSLALSNNLDGIEMFIETENKKQKNFSFTFIQDSPSVLNPGENSLDLTIGGKSYGIITYNLKSGELFPVRAISAFLLALTLIALATGFVYKRALLFLKINLVNPLHELGLKLSDAPDIKSLSHLPGSISQLLEVDSINKALAKAAQAIESSEQRIRELEVGEAVGKVAAQVAHDIRSPLAALAAADELLAPLDQDTRMMIKLAVNRIRDIANDLLRRTQIEAKKTLEVQTEPHSAQPLAVLLETIVSEKGLQYRSRKDVVIKFSAKEAAYGLFAVIQPVEFARVISNLLDNAVEAIGSTGEISIFLHSELNSSNLNVDVVDNGQGIPPEILPQLMELGATFGKEHGTGLGLFHARTTVNKWSGAMNIESTEGKGTIIRIQLPKSNPPAA